MCEGHNKAVCHLARTCRDISGENFPAGARVEIHLKHTDVGTDHTLLARHQHSAWRVLQLCSPGVLPRAETSALLQVPRVGSHLKREGVLATMFCSHWFITLFAYTLPFDHLLRVWDVLFLEGPKIIFRRATAKHCFSLCA